ncbi:MAG TPA: DUF92 domain-containing protein [Thermoplasmata archaeon]|nr:DUF92 domain-containing protein [Thermoplasmata archaeon]
MALDLWGSALVSLGMCGVLCYLAYAKDVLTLDGSVAAFAVGMVIGIFGDVTWLFLLLFFLLSSFLATRYKFALKEAMGVQEGVKGERRASNVLANGIAPMAAAILSFVNPPWLPRTVSGVVFLSGLAVAGSDTLASEIGVLSPKAYLITSFKRVTPGTDGGVSVLGQMCAVAAALYTAVVGWFILGDVARMYGMSMTMPGLPEVLLVPAVLGFVGCQIDSVIGATLERRGIVNKKTTNLLATSAGAILAYAILAVWFPALMT